jgi:hypothetical protein
VELELAELVEMDPTVRRWFLAVGHPIVDHVPDLVCSDIDANIVRTVNE